MSGYAGTCWIGFALQEFGDHFVISAPNNSGFSAGLPTVIAPAFPETRLYTGTRPRILDRNGREIECAAAVPCASATAPQATDTADRHDDGPEAATK
jgi:hypothetical protein